MSADAPALSCQELVELVTEYLEGVLGEADRTRFDAHLSSCPGCRTYLDQMRTTLEVSGRVREDDVPRSIYEIDGARHDTVVSPVRRSIHITVTGKMTSPAQ